LTILNKTKIIQIIKFGIYLLLGFCSAPTIASLFLGRLSYENNELIVVMIYLIIGCFAHFGFRKFARKIGLINKEKKAWEGSITIFAFIYWLTNSFAILFKDYRMNS